LKRTLPLTIASLSFILIGAAGAQSRDLAIECPAFLEVESSLTRGPWKGPDSRGRLEATSVRREAGKTALVCDYGAPGTAEIKAPTDYPSCTPSVSGFVCSDGRGSQSRTRVDTIVELRSNDGVNLDNGRINTNRRDDIFFTGHNGPYVALKTINGARLSRPLRNYRTPRDCQRRNFKNRELLLDQDIWTGSAVCFRTNRNRSGVLIVEGRNRNRIQLAIKTWSLDKPAAPTASAPGPKAADLNYGRGGMPVRNSLEFQFPGSAIVGVNRGNDGVRFSAVGGNTEHYAALGNLQTPAGKSVLTFDIRPESARKFRVQLYDSSPNGILVDFDLANNTAQLQRRNILLEPNVTVQTVGGNWRRVTMTGLFPGKDRQIILQLLDVNGNTSFAPAGQRVLVRNLTLK